MARRPARPLLLLAFLFFSALYVIMIITVIMILFLALVLFFFGRLVDRAHLMAVGPVLTRHTKYQVPGLHAHCHINKPSVNSFTPGVLIFAATRHCHANDADG